MRLLLLLFLALLDAPTPAVASTVAPRDSTLQERNKAIARRVFDEIFNRGRVEVGDEIYAPDFVNHGLHRDFSLAEDRAAQVSELRAFPDLRISIDRMVAEGDLVTVVWTFRGTHTGFGFGLPPTGARIEVRGITVWRIVDGRIRDEWSSFNTMGAYVQVLRHLRWPLAGAAVVLAALVWLTVRLVRRRRRPAGA